LDKVENEWLPKGFWNFYKLVLVIDLETIRNRLRAGTS